MALTVTQIEKAKPGAKPIKLADEKGMFLLLQPSGGKLWRLKYRFGAKEKKLNLGRYPDVSLKEARVRRDEARTMIANGVDPNEAKKAKERDAQLNAATTFQLVGLEYLEKASNEGRAEVTTTKARWLLSLMTPDLGSRPIGDITPAELLTCLRKVEAKGNRETARRMRSLAGRIFRYAVATSRATSDPAAFLRGALTAPVVAHHSAILDPAVLGALLRQIDDYSGNPLTRLALQLTPHVYARPGMLRQAEWAEIDLEKGIWSLSEGRMKMRRPHSIPLSRQAVGILHAAHQLTAGRQYVFSSVRNRPMSENTVNNALRRLGYGSKQVTAHGFRATASSLLNESGRWSVDAIERSLAHKDASVRGIYHRGAHWAERVEMAQWWSDYLDQLRNTTASNSPI